MPSRRILRVNELIHEEVSLIIQRELKDPRVGFVTVSEVDVADDLKFAKVFVTVYGTDKQKEDSIIGLNEAKGFIRKEIARRVNLRYTPEFVFKFDDTLEKSSRIEEILNQIRKSETNNTDNQ